MKRRALLSTLVLLPLAGCGFQLRGQAKLPYSRVFVTGVETTDSLVAQLRRSLAQAGVTLTATPKEAEAVVRVTNVLRAQEILSLSGTGRVREYRLRLDATYQVTRPGGEPLAPDATAKLSREYTYDDSLYLAKNAERDFLYQDMEQEAVGQILRQLRNSDPH
jgi:LPS-assembly lipoprotein